MPGSECAQEHVIEQLVAVVRLQLEMRPMFATTSGMDAVGAQHHPQSSTTDVRFHLLLHALSSLHESVSLPADMRVCARFYAEELDHWLRTHEPMMSRRLGELLSSSLRLHLAAIFSEEEGESSQRQVNLVPI